MLTAEQFATTLDLGPAPYPVSKLRRVTLWVGADGGERVGWLGTPILFHATLYHCQHPQHRRKVWGRGIGCLDVDEPGFAFGIMTHVNQTGAAIVAE
jgi:hypothetical protein